MMDNVPGQTTRMSKLIYDMTQILNFSKLYSLRRSQTAAPWRQELIENGHMPNIGYAIISATISPANKKTKACND